MESNETLLREILNLEKESSERDTRLESKIEYMTDRIENIEEHSDKQDEKIDKLTEIVSDQKQMARTVDTLVNIVNENTKRIVTLEQNKAEKSTVNDLSEKIKAIETKPEKFALSIWKKIIFGIGAALLASLIGYLGFLAKNIMNVATKGEL